MALPSPAARACLPAWVLAALLGGAAGCGPGLTSRASAPLSPGAPSAAADASSAAADAAPGPSAGATAAAATEPGAHDDEDAHGLPGLAPAEDPPADGSGLDLAPPGATPTATRYAALDRPSCEAELGRRQIAFERVGEARGVVAPLRLKGPIGGVEFRSMLPAAQRATSPYEIYDCRLVLALHDWARVLTRHDVVEVVHYSVYRPPPAKAVLHGPGRRHSGALAIDAAIFKTKDGGTLNVEKDFHGRIGGKPCGAGAGAAPSAGLPAPAVTLRQLVCEAAEAQLFNVMLTPDYNWPHRNHFHLEVTAGARWVLVR